MSNRYSIMLALLLIISAVHTSLSRANSLINVSVDNDLYIFSDDIYNFVARLAAKGVIEDFPKNIFPYSQGEVAKFLTETKTGKIKLSAIEEKQLETIKTMFPTGTQGAKKPLFDIRSDEYYFSAGGDVAQKSISRKGASFPVNGTVSISSLRPSVSGHVKDSFAFSSDMKWEFHVGDIFSDLFPDETRTSYSRLHMENVASMQAYGKFKLPWFELELGKDNIRWGPGYHGQLVISDNPQPVDMVKLGGRYGRIGFQSFTAKLKSSIGDKYMSAHRVEGVIWKGIDVGISEVIVYGDRFEASYMNPFQIYLITESMTSGPAGMNDNVLSSVDFSYRIVNGFQVYGELVVDDAAPFKDPLNHWDTKFGILAGLYIVDPFSIPDTDFRTEYAFINQYCYTHEKPINTYTNINSVIGHWLGTDADDLWCELKHRFTNKIETILTYELERHGEGNINKPHPTEAPANDRWTFLSGVTQYKHALSIGVSCTKIGYYSFKIKYKHSWLRNINNSKGTNSTENQVALEGNYRF